MTTIIYSQGKMVSDSRAYSGGAFPLGEKTKIVKLSDGRLLGVSSNRVGMANLVKKWIEEGMSLDKPPIERNKDLFEAILADTNETYYINGEWSAVKIEAPYMAIGTGSEYALAAMLLGKDPEVALAVAIHLDVWSDYPIYEHHLIDDEVKVSEKESMKWHSDLDFLR